MNAQDNDDNFAQRARQVFLTSSKGLGGETSARLREARRLAVLAAERPRPFWHAHGMGLPAGALALLFVAVVGGALWWSGINPSPPVAEPFASGNNYDLPIVLTSDNLDMYADLDFYQWLETQDQPAAPAKDPTDDSDDTDDDSDEGG